MRKLLYMAAGLVAFATAAPAQQRTPADSLLRAGRQAINASDYRKAVALLKQAVDKYPSSPEAGDALYWRAYAQYQTGINQNRKNDLEEALSALQLQQKAYAKASMAADGRDLLPRIQSALAKLGDADAARNVSERATKLGEQRGCPPDTDDMRIAALDGLMQMETASALPILTKVLQNRGACTENLRKHAVFVLSQKRGDDAATLLLSTARSDPSADVREEAVQWLGQNRSERATAALDSIVFNTTDHDIRDKALFALSQQNTPRAAVSLRRAAEDERLPSELRGQAVFWLGQQHLADVEFFAALFKKTKAQEVRDQIFMAIGDARSPDASKWLLDIARDKSVDIESRKNAIFHAGERRSLDFDLLAALYDQSRGEREIQDQVLFVFSNRREPAAVDKLISIAKNDPNKELKKQAIFWLGQKRDPRAVQFLMDMVSPP